MNYPSSLRNWRMGLAAPTGNEVIPQHIWIEMDKFDPAVNSALKENLPGPARWNSKSKRWIFPLIWETCTGARRVADKFRAEIKISAALNTWALAERERQDAIPDVNSMELVNLERVRREHHAIWDAIERRPFQTVGAAFAARNRNCLIADQPGLGKTVQSIAAVIESGITGPILVVAPKAAARLTWPQELKKWLPGDDVLVIGAQLSKADRATILDGIRIDMADDEDHYYTTERVWIITSPNYLRIRAEVDNYGNYVRDTNGQKIIRPVAEGLIGIQSIVWSAVIVDESHQTLPVPSGNKKKQSAQRLGIGALEIRRDGLRLALSGTPFRGKEVYLWGTLNWLRPDLYRSYWKWVNRHFDTWQDRYGLQIGRLTNTEGMYLEAKQVMIRRTKAEVAKDLPTKIYNDIWLDMEPQQFRVYKQMEANAAATLDDGQLLANGVLAEMTRLKQFAGSYGRMGDDGFHPTLPSNKFDWLVEFLEERAIDGDLKESHEEQNKYLPKIVVASQFSQLIDAFAAGFKDLNINVHKFTGSTSDANREAIKHDWQENPNSATRVLLLTTTAGGVSLTLDAADELVLLDETWNPSDQEQVEDRLHRLSRIHQVTIWRVRSKDTIEESIAKDNIFAENNIKDIIDGQRGVEFIKQVLNVQ